MAKMLEGLKYLYSGVNWKQRQLSLFSICGIAGLLNGFISPAGIEDIIEISIFNKIMITLALILFGLFITGYEIIFMHERRIPDIDMRSFKYAFNKIPFIVFLIGVPFLVVGLFTKYQYLAFCLETLFAIPLTMMQAGFSYDYNNNGAFMLFKKFKIKEYLLLLIKRLWVIIISYIITFALIFLIFFIAGIVIAFSYKGDVSALSLTISSHQTMILKLSNYIMSILLTYILTSAALVWDYELITTGEMEE